MVERVSPSLSQERPGLAFCFIDYVNVKHYIINAGGWFRFYKNRETLKEWFAKIHLPNTFAKARNQEMVLSKRCFNARQINESNAAKKVKNTFEEYRKTQDYKTSILSTANTLKLSKASVTSYLPYEKGVYFPNIADKEKISVGAERQRRYRAVRKLRTEPTEEHLWEVVLLYAGVRFKTYSGLPFTYEIRKGRNGQYTKELWIDRRENSKSLEEIVRNALTAQIKQAEHVLEILHERERKALICFSALERQEEKLSAEKAEIVKQRVALYEQYADGNISKEEFIRQRDVYRAQEDERMGQIQRLRTEKNQIFQPVKKDTDNLQAVMDTVGEAGDVMHLSQNVVETFIDRIEVFNNERVKIHFTFEDTLNSYEEK